MKTRPRRVFRGGRILPPATAYAIRDPLAPQLAAVPKLTMRFPVTEYVASLAMVGLTKVALANHASDATYFVAGTCICSAYEAFGASEDCSNA